MKPILVGMVNPISVKPEHALYPAPEGCTGHRIFRMLKSRVPEVTERQYLEAFVRLNLCIGEWEPAAARRSATVIASTAPIGTTIVLFGREVQKAFGLKDPPDVLPRRGDDLFVGVPIFRCLPHPSGRCRWYHDPLQREAASLLLEELYMRSER